MKKLAILLCAGGIAIGATAQQSVRIGSLEFSVKKSPDTTTLVNLSDCPPCPEDNEKKPFRRFHKSTPMMGIGFIQPNIGSGHYTTLGGKSINLDFGWLHRYQVAQRFALLLSFHYSYYNYKLHDAAGDAQFRSEVLGGKIYTPDQIEKQVFRSHNLALGGWMRFYIAPPRKRENGGLFVDLGIQGDYAFSKHYKLFPHEEKKKEYNNDYAFNAFPVFAAARVGWRGSAIFARYRFTDAFNQKALPLDLPRVTIGIQFL